MKIFSRWNTIRTFYFYSSKEIKSFFCYLKVWFSIENWGYIAIEKNNKPRKNLKGKNSWKVESNQNTMVSKRWFSTEIFSSKKYFMVIIHNFENLRFEVKGTNFDLKFRLNEFDMLKSYCKHRCLSECCVSTLRVNQNH